MSSLEVLLRMTLVGLAATASACRLHRVEAEPAPPLPLPPAWTGPAAPGPPSQEPWWLGFRDSRLEELVGQALAGNLDLRTARSRLAQAEALADKAGGGLWPSLRLESNASRSRQVVQLGGPLGAIAGTLNQFSLSLAAAYELDLWGRNVSLADASARDAEASRDDLGAAAMTVAARVAETWFNLVEKRAQRALLEEQLQASRTYLALVEARFGQGLASALEVYQQRQQRDALEAQVPGVESAMALLRHQLATLQGRPPGEPPPEGGELPALPPLPPAGVPADLLAQRPDVRAARARAVAADHRLAAATADLLPSLKLSGRFGYQSRELGSLLDDYVWSLGAGLTAPLFEGGARAAEVDRSHAVREERLQELGRVLLAALREVEDALAREAHQQDYLAALGRQLESAAAGLREARNRYLGGLADYLNVLSALNTLQQVERTRLAARRELLVIRVELCRALGGSWTEAEAAAPRPGMERDRI